MQIKIEPIFAMFLDLQKMREDPSYSINISGDIKEMLHALKSEKGREAALHGGGGSKAQNERAAALAAILSPKAETNRGSKQRTKGESEVTQTFSIVDAASASVHGRSAAAAKAASSDKTAARVAMHMAGERVPVNAKLVSHHSILLRICSGSSIPLYSH